MSKITTDRLTGSGKGYLYPYDKSGLQRVNTAKLVAIISVASLLVSMGRLEPRSRLVSSFSDYSFVCELDLDPALNRRRLIDGNQSEMQRHTLNICKRWRSFRRSTNNRQHSTETYNISLYNCRRLFRVTVRREMRRVVKLVYI